MASIHSPLSEAVVAHITCAFIINPCFHIGEIHGRQPELKITAADMLCVELAGLCHDLGHGPFSHLFDAKVLPRIVKDPSFHFEHEHASIGIFDLLIQENGLLSEFHKNGLNEDDIHFIKVIGAIDRELLSLKRYSHSGHIVIIL